MDCAVSAAFGTAPAAPAGNSQSAADGTTRTQAGMARFDDNCSGSPDFFIIRVGGSASNEIRFELRNGHKVHIQVPTGAVYAGQCGSFPGSNHRFDFIRLD